jgi:hypothetical protein
VVWAAVVILLLAAGSWALGIAPHANYIASVRGYRGCVAEREERLQARPSFVKLIKQANPHIKHHQVQMFAEGRCQTIRPEWEDLFDFDPDTPLGTPNQDLPA